VSMGGENLDADLVVRTRKVISSGCEIWNEYGPTETAGVALAVLGTVLAFTLGGDEGNPGSGGKGGGAGKEDTAATSGAGAGEGSAKDDKPAADASDEPKRDDTAGTPDGADQAEKDDAEGGGKEGGSGVAVPGGYKLKTDDRFNFTMALPGKWKRTGIAGENSGGIYSASGGFPRVQVDFNSNPTDDAVAAWRGLERAVRGSMTDYTSLGIRSVEYRGYPTVADWSFEQTLRGQRVRVLNRGFKVDSKHGYSIMITCKKDGWDERTCKTLRETAFRTFRPVG